MPDEIKKDGPDSVFSTPRNIYNKKIENEPVPGPQIGIDTDNAFFSNIVDSSISSTLDMSAFDNFLNTSRSRDQVYSLLDTMCEDSMIAAVLKTYAEDATERNENNGRIMWVDSSDPEVARHVTYLLDAIKVDKNIYGWTHSLCKYGDLYLRLYRKSEYDDDVLADKFDSNRSRVLNEELTLSTIGPDPDVDKIGKEELKEGLVNVKAYSKNDPYALYLEAESNPAEMFELTKLGKSYAYIRTDINSAMASNKDWYQGSSFLQRYNLSTNDIDIYGATEYVHGCLEDDANRTPEEVCITLDRADKESTKSSTYKVRKGQSLFYNLFKIWRELTLLESSVLLNRVTKSSVVRAIGVEVGDMPKDMVQNHLMGIKRLIEQKASLDTGNSMNEYTNPGPVENNIYIPTHDGVGALSVQQIGGDVNVGQLTDLDYFRDKLFSGLQVPKQYFGWTEDGAGFNGGQSLSIISSRYAKTVKHIQNTLIQTLTDAINLILFDRGLTRYINKFKLCMLAPTTQEELDRRESTSGKVQLAGDIMNMLTDIEDTSTKLKILKSLLSDIIADPEVIQLIQQEIDKLDKAAEEAEAGGKTPVESSGGEDDFGLDLGLGGGEDESGFDLDSALGLTEPSEGEPAESESGLENAVSAEESARIVLPTPSDLGLDLT